jgi:hypothetical protein
MADMDLGMAPENSVSLLLGLWTTWELSTHWDDRNHSTCSYLGQSSFFLDVDGYHSQNAVYATESVFAGQLSCLSP